MALFSIAVVILAASLIKTQFRAPHVTYETRDYCPWYATVAVGPAIFVVLAPLCGLMLGSISDSELVPSLEQGGTLRWWREAFHDHRLVDASLRTLINIALALAVGIPLGLTGALVDWRKRLLSKVPVASPYAIWFLPWLIPPTALGITIGLMFRSIGISLGLATTAVFHSLFLAPIAAALCTARLDRISSRDIELTRLLSVPQEGVLIRYILPEIVAGIIMAALLGSNCAK